jgi:hypothetical protein
MKRKDEALAPRAPVPYSGFAVKQPFISCEEEIDRLVGRRLRSPDGLVVETSRKADAIAWREAVGGVNVPRGVHRFRTHEEADEWLWRMIARPRPS